MIPGYDEVKTKDGVHLVQRNPVVEAAAKKAVNNYKVHAFAEMFFYACAIVLLMVLVLLAEQQVLVPWQGLSLQLAILVSLMSMMRASYKQKTMLNEWNRELMVVTKQVIDRYGADDGKEKRD